MIRQSVFDLVVAKAAQVAGERKRGDRTPVVSDLGAGKGPHSSRIKNLESECDFVLVDKEDNSFKEELLGRIKGMKNVRYEEMDIVDRVPKADACVANLVLNSIPVSGYYKVADNVNQSGATLIACLFVDPVLAGFPVNEGVFVDTECGEYSHPEYQLETPKLIHAFGRRGYDCTWYKSSSSTLKKYRLLIASKGEVEFIPPLGWAQSLIPAPASKDILDYKLNARYYENPGNTPTMKITGLVNPGWEFKGMTIRTVDIPRVVVPTGMYGAALDSNGDDSLVPEMPPLPEQQYINENINQDKRELSLHSLRGSVRVNALENNWAGPVFVLMTRVPSHNKSRLLVRGRNFSGLFTTAVPGGEFLITMNEVAAVSLNLECSGFDVRVYRTVPMERKRGGGKPVPPGTHDWDANPNSHLWDVTLKQREYYHFLNYKESDEWCPVHVPKLMDGTISEVRGGAKTGHHLCVLCNRFSLRVDKVEGKRICYGCRSKPIPSYYYHSCVNCDPEGLHPVEARLPKDEKTEPVPLKECKTIPSERDHVPPKRFKPVMREEEKQPYVKPMVFRPRHEEVPSLSGLPFLQTIPKKKEQPEEHGPRKSLKSPYFVREEKGGVAKECKPMVTSPNLSVQQEKVITGASKESKPKQKTGVIRLKPIKREEPSELLDLFKSVKAEEWDD